MPLQDSGSTDRRDADGHVHLQEPAMKRTYFIAICGLAALLFIVLVQSNGVIAHSAARVPSESSTADPAATVTPEIDGLYLAP
ncbi:MAG: hypothetical protein ACM3PU_07950 [Gemmatimonadota bacterium]